MEIVQFPHPTLRHKSKLLKRVDAELKSLVRQMFELMYAARGVGLAANQVHLPVRLFVANLEGEAGKGEELVFINPVLSHPKGSEEADEGCLSLPGLYGRVIRPKQTRVAAYNLAGEEVNMALDGLLARVVQHETDHLDGVLFIDRLSSTARMDAEPEIQGIAAQYLMRRERGEVPSDQQLAAEVAALEAKYC